jgi:hypothetical protein
MNPTANIGRPSGTGKVPEFKQEMCIKIRVEPEAYLSAIPLKLARFGREFLSLGIPPPLP